MQRKAPAQNSRLEIKGDRGVRTGSWGQDQTFPESLSTRDRGCLLQIAKEKEAPLLHSEGRGLECILLIYINSKLPKDILKAKMG